METNLTVGINLWTCLFEDDLRLNYVLCCMQFLTFCIVISLLLLNLAGYPVSLFQCAKFHY